MDRIMLGGGGMITTKRRQVPVLLASAVVALTCNNGSAKRAPEAAAARADLNPAISVLWVADGLDRVAPNDPPGPSRSASIQAARGEYEPVQVVIRASASGLTHTRVSVSDLVGPSGRIASSHVALFRERYVRVDVSSRDPGRGNRPLGPGWYPDALLPLNPRGSGGPGEPFSVEPSSNQPIWADVYVPRDTAAGAYAATITVSSDQWTATVPLALTVWSFELPLKPSLKSSVGLSEQTYLDKRYQELLLRHRLVPRVIRASDAGDLMERFGLPITGLRFWPSNHGCSMKPAPAVEELRAAAATYPPGLDLFVYAADEIENSSCLFPTVKEWARNVHQTRARTLVTVPPLRELLDDGTGRSAVDIWAVLPKLFDSSDEAFRAARRAGNEIWAYTALMQDDFSPKWLIDFAPINYRIMPGFLSQSLGVTGLVYWSTTLWSSDPWTDLDYVDSGGHHHQGEGLLIYPGRDVGVDGGVASMRLKWIREGVEDYEYVQLLKQAGRAEFALEVARGVGADWRHWTKDPAVLREARRRLGEELDRIHRGNP
jgi:hypothetical protein